MDNDRLGWIVLVVVMYEFEVYVLCGDIDVCKLYLFGFLMLVIFGFVYMLLMMVFMIYGFVMSEMNGYLMVVYVVMLIVMLFIVCSYGYMVWLMLSVGLVYMFVSCNFGMLVGFMVGWVLLMDYLFILMISYFVIGIYMK